MNVLLWVIFGALMGWIASMLVTRREYNKTVIHIAVGVIGAIAGGWIMHELVGTGITTFSIMSLMVAVGSASALLLAFRIIERE